MGRNRKDGGIKLRIRFSVFVRLEERKSIKWQLAISNNHRHSESEKERLLMPSPLDGVNYDPTFRPTHDKDGDCLSLVSP